jgi:hypothetical protein
LLSVLRKPGPWPGQAADSGDDGTNDVLVSNVIRTTLQVWFVAEHVVDTPVVRVDDANRRSQRPAPEVASADADSRAVEHAQAAGQRAFPVHPSPRNARADPEAVVDATPFCRRRR